MLLRRRVGRILGFMTTSSRILQCLVGSVGFWIETVISEIVLFFWREGNITNFKGRTLKVLWETLVRFLRLFWLFGCQSQSPENTISVASGKQTLNVQKI